MEIPRTLPQFEKFPALFVASGEYEAHFLIALNGKIEQIKAIKMSPREDAKEKQAFVGHKAGMQSLSSVSHHGNYVADLKMKFVQSMHETIHALIAEYKLEEIYIFAPKYVIQKVISSLDKSEQKKVRMRFYKEYIKDNPLKLIELINLEFENIQKVATKNPKEPILLQ